MDADFIVDLGVSRFTAEIILEEMQKEVEGFEEKIRGLEESLTAAGERRKEDLSDFEKRLAGEKIDRLLELEILKAKGKNPRAIKALLDVRGLSLGEAGELLGLDLTKLMESDPYLFDREEELIRGTGIGSGEPQEVFRDPEKMDYDTYKRWRKKQ